MLYCLRDVSIQYEKDTYDKTIVFYKERSKWKKKVNLNFVSFKMNESLNLKALCRIIFDPKRPYLGSCAKG